MKKFTLVSLILVLVLNSTISFASDTRKATGLWKLYAPEAPNEYTSSSMIVSEAAGSIAVKLVFADGQSVKAASVSLLNDVLKFSLSIEGYDVPFTGKIAGNILSGTVETPDGVIAVKGDKITLTGSWDYNAPDAPYDYSTGKLVFDEKDGKQTAKVILGGNETQVSDLKTDGTSFSFIVYIESETVKIAGKLVGEKIVGKAEYSDGQIDLTAVRSKTKK
jgi:hypothetical protein